jgi:hypothetical protein
MSQQLTFPIGPDGLALDVQIGLPAHMLQAKLAQGQPFPAALTVRAYWTRARMPPLLHPLC